MLSKLAVRRLTKLADYMQRLPAPKARHFEMYEWFTHKEEEIGLSNIVKGVHGIQTAADVRRAVPIECGMAACAFGWATMMPAFKKAGLTVILDGPTAYPSFRGQRAFDAASAFFHIGKTQAEALFNPHPSPKSPKTWAKHCRKFLRENV